MSTYSFLCAARTVAHEQTAEHLVQTGRGSPPPGADSARGGAGLCREGLPQSNTKEIAAAAGVAEGTIYNYFESKRALLFALLEEIASETIGDVLTGSPLADPRQLLDSVLESRAAMLAEHGRLLAPIIAEIFIDAELREEVYQQILAPVLGLLEEAIRHWMEEGAFRAVNPTIITHAIVGASMLNLLFKQNIIDERYADFAPEDIRAELIAFFLHGIAALTGAGNQQ